MLIDLHGKGIGQLLGHTLVVMSTDTVYIEWLEELLFPRCIIIVWWAEGTIE